MGVELMGNDPRSKGAAAERECQVIIRSILEPIYREAGLEAPRIRRNLEQSRSGGFDLEGLPWLAVEVKRQEFVRVEQWWRQTVEQAGEGQIPFLLWRGNYMPWRCRTVASVAVGNNTMLSTPLTLDLERTEWEEWLRWEAWSRIQSGS